MLEDLLRLLTLRDANTRTVLLGVGLLGLAAGVSGCFAVLRRRALIGDAVAHAALPGVCIAYLVVGERSLPALMLGALAFGVASAVFIGLVRRTSRIKEDAAIAIVIGSLFGLGVALSRIIQSAPGGDKAGLDGFIFGKAASMVRADAALIAAVAGLVVAAVVLLYKEFKVVSFDPDFAAGQGWPTLRLDLAMTGLVTVCVVAGLPAVGVILMVALVVIPAVTARLWTDRLGVMIVIAGAVGALSGVVGTSLSAVLPPPVETLSRGWPAGPLVVLVAVAAFGVSALAAPSRGVLSVAVRRARLRRRVEMQNLLRAMYELGESAGDFDRAWTEREICAATRRESRERTAAAPRAAAKGLLRRAEEGYALTEAGLAEALAAVRAHRLWELYLIEEASIAADHVDRDADQIEHVLPPGVVRELERRLRDAGRLPADGLHSPHPVALERRGT